MEIFCIHLRIFSRISIVSTDHYSKSMLRTISNLNVLKTQETTKEESNGDVVITYLNISQLLKGV
jgi:hypothetical protein